MKIVYWKQTTDARKDPMVYYWIKQLDSLTFVKFTIIKYSKKFSWKEWRKLQRHMLALWIDGEEWKK